MPLLRVMAALLLLSVVAGAEGAPVSISGRYLHLAMFNHQGECGSGAVVPWAGRLWVITYSPHKPQGSDDKLYEIDEQLHRVTRPESVGGTPAGRLIHRESNQLIIGPYVIDAQRRVRVVPPSKMPGRLTAVTRSLTDPANCVYIFDMEGRIYHLNVHTLSVEVLFDRPVPGWHGKGAHTSQGRLVIANNGESAAFRTKSAYLAGAEARNEEEAGALAEWDGKTWRIVARRQFNEVTTAGGIHGPPSEDAPLWSIGWDKRSLLLQLLDQGTWSTYRLPKADYSYDGRHGWHTEWPRIRQVTEDKYLMNMHGGWFDFPCGFSAGNTAGLRPIASYLKITADFAPWQKGIVFGCDDAAMSDFRGGKSEHAQLTGQSQSNLWFTTWKALADNGRPMGSGGPWAGDDILAGQPSLPFLFAGYAQRVLHLSHQTDQPVRFAIEIDTESRGRWSAYRTITVPARSYTFHVFPADVSGEWIRLTLDRNARKVTAFFQYGPGGGVVEQRNLFAGLSDIGRAEPWFGGVVRLPGQDRGTLLYHAQAIDSAGKVVIRSTHAVRPDMTFQTADDPPPKPGVFPSQVEVQVDEASVVLSEGKKRFRLPRGDSGYDVPQAVSLRMFREVVTERSLLNVHGSFYMVPRSNSGGAARMKPICTHTKRIADFCSWRGLLVLAGTRAGAGSDGHVFPLIGEGPRLWFGDIDDLWKIGPPRGVGGPWHSTPVQAGTPSDPYLMLGYDRKQLSLSHDSPEPVTFRIEVDVLADGTWWEYGRMVVMPGRTLKHDFPPGYSAHWVRLQTDRPAKCTATFTYSK